MRKFRDLTGQTFGQWTVIESAGYIERPNDQKRISWRCRCSCGKERVISPGNLINGATKGCGCRSNRANLSKGPHGPLFAQYKKNAVRHKYSFELSEKQFCELITRNCTYCGVLPSNVYKFHPKCENSVLLYSGLNRLDSSKGYTMDNSVPCCKTCNLVKSKLSVEDWESWMLRFVLFNQGKLI